MSKAILIFDSYETLKKHYGKKALITISLLDDKGEATYHSTEYAILKPLPMRAVNIETVLHNDGLYYIEELQPTDFDRGFNACLDKILGGKIDEYE